MELRLALIGFGGVNQGLVQLLDTKREVLRAYGIDLKVTAVVDLRMGVLTNPGGFPLDVLLNCIECGLEVKPLLNCAGTDIQPNADLATTLKVIASDIVDVVVEATFTDPNTGEPALSHCRTALESGKHVITTNKGPVALAFKSLMATADAHGARLMFEGSVMSGTPVIRQLSTTLRGAEIRAFSGILNGTSNFVLGKVAAGDTFEAAVKDAQARGYAEANPAADIEGSDVQMKVLILANALWGADLRRSDVHCEGITGLSEEAIRSAPDNGSSWRLIGRAQRNEDGTIVAGVSPQLLPAGHPLLAATGVTNAITFDTDTLGSVTISGPGAGRVETAFAIFSDILELASVHNGAAREGTK
ncbi:homoserine dehydrogenase [Paraburkholderia sp. J8-2]|uniref:homoserine dehydrogenase n=1 Tax=Paraburkholderia sp. J8-2 TaxID=2805440 RepID=UPI002AB7C792|nr:homoserine dehydrogenase [Paraburkholderia sp. J8-2]